MINLVQILLVPDGRLGDPGFGLRTTVMMHHQGDHNKDEIVQLHPCQRHRARV